ncbi:hypothetical protein BO78DRAFT_442225 [Aspergillus sclerotiicarbonarius CBS 121057]|uniref:AB hydrolase-1 domain-containing protein n=1 Tax=Aspergillus sclerotiicarbonarius (strain CBS 121057 / IBT 28362) TaxID=1448318 RepID=A0A319EMN8_ASPSB|nr:hypothetical protein BO78DRAFT_442225 [Aspergillus sclerotiicarbonarius CBS 121057]
MAISPDHQVAVVICTASYHTPAPYGPFMEALTSHGLFEAHCPQRATCDLSKLNVGDDFQHPDFNRDPPPGGGYPNDLDDVQIVHQLLDRLINQENKLVLLLGHSSGGLVATQAAIPELQYKNRGAQKGGVIGIFYVGRFVVPVGESVHSFFQPKDGSLRVPPFVQFYKHGKDGLATTIETAQYMFKGLDDPQAVEKWTATLTASPVNTGTLTNDAYAALPCAYVVLDEDTCLPSAYQEGMIAVQTQRENVNFTVYHAPTGHSPHLSWMEPLVGTVVEFLEAVRRDLEC